MRKKELTSILFLLMITLLLPSKARAYDFMVDGLCYNRNSDGTSVTVTSETDADLEDAMFGYASYASLSGDVEIPASVSYEGATYSVTSIGDYAFLDCTGLTSVEIPNSVTSIGAYAFLYCTGLTNVEIPNSVTKIGNYAFWHCHGLTSVSIGNSVTIIGCSAFEYCSSLTSVNIPNSVTSIGEGAFRYCSDLTSVTWNVIYCSYFAEYDHGGDVSYSPFPNGIKSFTFGDEVKIIPSFLCKGLSGLTSVNIPNSVTSIGDEAFYGCSGLTSVNIGSAVTSIGSGAFANCTGLTSVKIPNSVTLIDSEAFGSCSGLTSVIWNARKCAVVDLDYLFEHELPDRIIYPPFRGSIGIKSFTFGDEVEIIPATLCSGLSGLTNVTNLAFNPQPINSSTFYNVNISACKLLVPQQSVSLYKDAPFWSDFGTISAIINGDLNDDSQVNTGDVSALYHALVNGSDDSKYDLNGDGNVNTGDVSTLYSIILGN